MKWAQEYPYTSLKRMTTLRIWIINKSRLRTRTLSVSTYDLTGKINQRLAQYINSSAWQRKQKWAWWETGWSSDVHLLCPPFILFFSLSLFSLLWAVIDLISSALNWSHDSCCSDWPSLTAHRHSSVMPSPIYLSICLCLLSLSLPSGKSTCCPHWSPWHILLLYYYLYC